jgi:hypothetical protein
MASPPDVATRLFDAAVDALEAAEIGKVGRAERALLATMLEQYLSGTAPSDHDDDEGDGSRNGEEAQPAEPPAHASDRLSARTALFKRLNRARKELRAVVPFGSVTEQLFVPSHSSQFDPAVPYYDIDAFLFDDNDLDGFVDQKLVRRQYCKGCRSSDHIAETQFITHSFSEEQLLFLGLHIAPLVARSVLGKAPTAAGAAPRFFRVADVGSRLGVAVATAAWSLAKMCRDRNAALVVRGLEISKEYCDVQRRFLKKVGLTSPAVDVMEGDAVAAGSEQLEFLRQADFVVLHNVFEWFVPIEQQLDIWRTIKTAVSRRGQHLLVVPPLTATLTPLFEHRQATSAAEGRSDAVAAAKQHRKEGGGRGIPSPQAEAAAFQKGWVETVDLSSLIDRFMMDRAEEEAGESEGDVQHTSEALGNMALYRVL